MLSVVAKVGEALGVPGGTVDGAMEGAIVGLLVGDIAGMDKEYMSRPRMKILR